MAAPADVRMVFVPKGDLAVAPEQKAVLRKEEAVGLKAGLVVDLKGAVVLKVANAGHRWRID